MRFGLCNCAALAPLNELLLFEVFTESGGPLSHGAVTAREMMLPAVMSVRDVISKLRDGQVVTVDGSQGVVRLGEH